MNKIRSASASGMKDLAGGGMTFPVSKDEIVDNARRQHLPPEVLGRLERIPDKEYDNIGELVREAGKELPNV